MEREIDEVFDYKGIKLKVVKGKFGNHCKHSSLWSA